MFGNLWNRLTGGRRQTGREREEQTPAERRVEGESADELEADEFTGDHLGGIHPDRLLDDGRPQREDQPPS